MKTIAVTRTIRAPIAQVFDQLTDLSNYTAFPGVRSVRFLREGELERNGVGAIRKVEGGLFWLQEEILGLARPYRMDYRIQRSRPAFHHQGGSMQLQETAGGTEVTWTSTFAIPLPLLSGPAEFLGGKMSELMFAAILRHVDRTLTA